MITAGNYDYYFLLFSSGASGAFLRFILHGLITKSDATIVLSDTNHAHYNLLDTGDRSNRGPDSTKRPSIRNCYFVEGSSKIARAHSFPSDTLINFINGKYVNPGIIVISGTQDEDLLEITGNYLIKSFNLETTTREQVAAEVLPLTYALKDFGNSNNTKDNLLVIKYNEIFVPIEDSFVGLRNLEDFTGTQATDKVLENYKTYVRGRKKLVQDKMKWLDLT